MKPFSVQVQNLSKNYGTSDIFKNISLAHSTGVLGIAGPNGSGKSTLLQCLAGLKRPSSGTVKWEKGNSPLDRKLLKDHLGYAAPYINLYDELSCTENLNFLMRLRGIKNSKTPIKKILDQTGVNSFSSKSYGNLSTGQRQRLRLAAALVHQPAIIFFDEPGANLDKKGRLLINSLISGFKEANKLVILASNSPEELKLCDRIYSVEQEVFL